MADSGNSGNLRDTIVEFLFCLIFAAILHYVSDVSWGVSFMLAFVFAYVFKLKDELRELRLHFSIADAELVRVSALANDLEQEVLDLREKVHR